ncbi:hypothetical protein DYH55_00225 [Methylovirgula sp. 4M-Z18]|nr:hypothetical protein DYH55_00225 [Methylovirgula sp. 4M-Z18]
MMLVEKNFAARTLQPGNFGYTSHFIKNLGNSATISAANDLRSKYGNKIGPIEMDLQGKDLQGNSYSRTSYPLPNGKKFSPDLHYPTQSGWSGKTLHFDENKGVGDLSGSTKNLRQVGAYSMAISGVNLASRSMRSVGYRWKIGGAAIGVGGLAYDIGTGNYTGAAGGLLVSGAGILGGPFAAMAVLTAENIITPSAAGATLEGPGDKQPYLPAYNIGRAAADYLDNTGTIVTSSKDIARTRFGGRIVRTTNYFANPFMGVRLASPQSLDAIDFYERMLAASNNGQSWLSPAAWALANRQYTNATGTVAGLDQRGGLDAIGPAAVNAFASYMNWSAAVPTDQRPEGSGQNIVQGTDNFWSGGDSERLSYADRSGVDFSFAPFVLNSSLPSAGSMVPQSITLPPSMPSAYKPPVARSSSSTLGYNRDTLSFAGGDYGYGSSAVLGLNESRITNALSINTSSAQTLDGSSDREERAKAKSFGALGLDTIAAFRLPNAVTSPAAKAISTAPLRGAPARAGASAHVTHHNVINVHLDGKTIAREISPFVTSILSDDILGLGAAFLDGYHNDQSERHSPGG